MLWKITKIIFEKLNGDQIFWWPFDILRKTQILPKTIFPIECNVHLNTDSRTKYTSIWSNLVRKMKRAQHFKVRLDT